MKRIRNLRMLPAVSAALLLAAPAALHADTPRARVAPQTALVAVGGSSAPDEARIPRSHQLRFRNDGAAATRIVFPRRNAGSVACATDGSTTSRSRPGQYLLEAGAELACELEPGRYRYQTYTQVDGAIQSAEARIRVQ